jgi:hypothetical protein
MRAGTEKDFPMGKLKEQEDKLFIRRNEQEGVVNRVVGRELTPLEFLQIRQAIGEFEECESRIEGVQLRMDDLKRWGEE